MASEFVTVEVDASPMPVYVALPDGPGPCPRVAVAQAQGGVDTFIRSVCDRLAAEGFATAAPDLYHRREGGMSLDEITSLAEDAPLRGELFPRLRAALKDDEIVHDVNAALVHLGSLSSVGETPMGVTGFSPVARSRPWVTARLPSRRLIVSRAR